MNDENACIDLETHEQMIRNLQKDIAALVYAQAAVYEAKKKRVTYGEFAWDYYDQAQGHALVIAKAIEHMNIEGYIYV